MPVTHTVTPTVGANGSVSPSTAQIVTSGATTIFTLTPASGYQIASVTGCGGTLSGSTYTTGAINGDCTVSASFSATPPVTTASPVGGLYSASQNVTLTANEPATIYYTTDGTIPTTASKQYTGPIPIDTSTVLKYFAVDAAGNPEAVKSATYIINTSANPTKVVLVLSAVGTTSKIEGIETIVTLPAGVTVQADAATGSVNAGVIETSGQARGGLSIARYTPPTATAPGTLRLALIYASGFSAGEFARLTCDVAPGISFEASSFSSNINSVIDTNGVNLTGVTTSIVLLTPPIFNISTLGDKAVTNNPTLNITGNVSDANGIVNLGINGVPVLVASDGGFTHSLLLSAGANIITTVATGNMGNQITDTRTITLDQTAPDLFIASPADNSKISRTSIDITGSVNETSAVEIKVNSIAAQTINRAGAVFSAIVNLTSGVNTIEITATDLAGNITSLKRTVTSDTGAPSLAVIDPALDITTGKDSIIIRGTVADAFSAVAVTISADGQTYMPQVINGEFSQAITFGIEKTYVVTVIATDEAGNHSVTTQRNIIYKLTHSGDLNGDNKVDIADALLALRIAVGLDTATADNYIYADVAPLKDGKPAPDGVIDIADALVILEKAVGLVGW